MYDRDRIRTCNFRIRSPRPYPLGHTTMLNPIELHLLTPIEVDYVLKWAMRYVRTKLYVLH